MEIIITKGKNRNTLTCKRKDGTRTSTNLGPDIPNHDIAHYVIEKQFQLTNGFYGKVQSGMNIQDLSDKEVIKSLDSETWLSEIMARNLQSIGSGASKTENFTELVLWEAQNMNGVRVPDINPSDVKHMESAFHQLCAKWESIPENGILKLIF